VNKSILDVLIERASVALYLDNARRIVKIKGETGDLLAMPAERALGTDIKEHLAPAYRDTIPGIIERCVDTGRSESVSLRFLTGNEPRQVLFIPRDFSATTWPERAVIQLQDITSGLRSHDVSFLSHELFNSILNDIGEGIMVMDPALNITHINDFAANLLGLVREELLGRDISALPSPLLVLMPGAETARIFEQGLESHKIAHVKQGDGEELSLLLNYYPVKDADSKVTHVVETIQDITEEQKTADKIQAINRRLQEKVRELSVLNKLSIDFNTCTSGEQLYPRIVSTIVCGLGFHDTAAVLSLRDAEGGPIHLCAFFGTEEEIAGQLIVKPDNEIPNSLIRVADGNLSSSLKKYGLSSAIYSPVVIEGETIGYLNVFHRSEDPIIREEVTLLRILSEHLGQFLKRVRAEGALKEKVLTLSILKSLSDALQAGKNLSQVYYVFLTGVTAEQGLGFNRALLFVLDEEGKKFRGGMGVGPATPVEADRIWRSLGHDSEQFTRLLYDFSRIDLLQATELNRIIRQQAISCDEGSYLASALKEGSPKRFKLEEFPECDDKKMLSSLGIEQFAAKALSVAGQTVAILIVDNFVNRMPISDGDLRFLELMSRTTQGHLENLRLYGELEKKVESLKRSNELLQEHRTRLAKLEQLGALGEMAASVAHEIRNPLVSVGGFARQLYDERTSDDPDSQYLKIIIDEVSRLENVITNLLNYAKPMKAKFRTVSLREVIQQAIAIVEPEFADAGLEIITRLDRSNDKVWIDPHLIRHMILNLMNNALRAMKPDDRLTISTRITSDQIRIAVRDTGRGIPKEHHARIFEPFFTTRSAGTGLGLAIVQNIVKAHGGNINLKSKVGSGTTFLITLPRVEPDGITRGEAEALEDE
jgi:PAS domain S-box-containing protein